MRGEADGGKGSVVHGFNLNIMYSLPPVDDLANKRSWHPIDTATVAKRTMATAAEVENFPAPLNRLLLPANGRSHMTSFCVVKTSASVE